MPTKPNEAGSDVAEKVRAALDAAYAKAEAWSQQGKLPPTALSARYRNALDDIATNSEKASTAFTNIITSLAIKQAMPSVDVRFHQTQIQNQTDRPAGFNFRGVSEKEVYPWLCEHQFHGAKSGWQARTLERPKPYSLNYDENIGTVKESFLAIYDEVEVKNSSALSGLAYLFFKQIQLREDRKLQLAIPKTDDIILIKSLFEQHFFFKYKGSKGASRLPVLALYAVYQVLVGEVSRYAGKKLAPLNEHSAADSQTGAVGDIEVLMPDGAVFEAVEVKHAIEVDAAILESVRSKVMDKHLDRYYVLTTHKNCEPAGLQEGVAQIQKLFGCYVIVNGVVPSLKYYLRLLSKPSDVFPNYVKLLQADKAISHEHRMAWNEVATRLKG